MKKVIGITATDFAGNKGAAAMLQAIVKNVKKEIEDVEFKLFSVYPREDESQNPYSYLEVVACKPEQIIFIGFPLAILYKLLCRVSFIKKLLLKNKILKGIDECDFIVDAAGISFVDSRGFVMNTYNFICVATPLLLGKKVIKFSQAMGPFNSFWNKLWAKLTLPHVTKICARGEVTYKHLIQLGLKNVEVCADGAFSMLDDEMSKKQVQAMLETYKLSKGEYVTLSISSVVNKYCKKNNFIYVGKMRELITYLNDRGYKVLIIANAARKGNSKNKNNDLLVCSEVYGSLENKAGCIWIEEEFTPEVIRELIGNSRMLIASRFHAMIGALEKGIPVLLIGWSHKYKEVLDMFKVGEYATDYKELSFESIIAKFEQLDQDYDSIRASIVNHLDKVKNSSYKNIQIILDELR